MMSAAELTFFWTPEEGGWTGFLSAEVTVGRYAGRAGAWFNSEDIGKTFVADLRRYPIGAESPARLEGLNQPSLSIHIGPFNRMGALLVETRLLASPDGDPHPAIGLENEATLRFATEYEAVSLFAAEIEALIEGKRTSATLKGHSPVP